MGNFRKIHTIPQTAFQDSEDSGGGPLNWKSEGMGETYDWNSECMKWGVRSGISTGDRQECIP